MANDKFPINSDIDYQHTITSNDAVLDLATLDWYGIKWFYRTSTNKKVAIAAYDKDADTGFTANLADLTPASGIVISHIQAEDMDIPVGVKIYWQPYTRVADALHGTDFNGAGVEVEAGVSYDADAVGL
jgi:hypothetical protein